VHFVYNFAHFAAPGKCRPVRPAPPAPSSLRHCRGIRMNGQIVNNVRLADDIDLIAETIEDLQETTDKVNVSSKRFGLEINKQKN